MYYWNKYQRSENRRGLICGKNNFIVKSVYIFLKLIYIFTTELITIYNVFQEVKSDEMF